jgi:hypothetical protein
LRERVLWISLPLCAAVDKLSRRGEEADKLSPHDTDTSLPGPLWTICPFRRGRLWTNCPGVGRWVRSPRRWPVFGVATERPGRVTAWAALDKLSVPTRAPLDKLSRRGRMGSVVAPLARLWRRHGTTPACHQPSGCGQIVRSDPGAVDKLSRRGAEGAQAGILTVPQRTEGTGPQIRQVKARGSARCFWPTGDYLTSSHFEYLDIGTKPRSVGHPRTPHAGANPGPGRERSRS